ncbi:hypothetical protein [Streptomyces ficellus]|uniref:Vegetative cell wall protein gp1 n=1 Tax=Streptomyces ficellus TaxID=1977088 RepID=A0A6I6FLB2_9ACTN|nr:hypothetical protein [Streptomyces ficellus]QGV78328.1 hypothetical protein EIZ62_08820 [Streptomyces ficellus]
MGGLLTELGKRLAERWMTLLVLPGALFLAAAFAARTLGHAHALDVGLLVREAQAWRPAPGAGAGTRLAVLLLVVALLAGAVGLVAQMLGSLVERLWYAADWESWPRPVRALARWRVARRRRRRADAVAAYEGERRRAGELLAAGAPGSRVDLRPARLAVARVSPEEPHRPTWSGDRMHAVALRLDRDLDLDLATVWPALWQLLPDAPRQQLETARDALDRATTLAAWAVLYAALAVWWWPALPVAAATYVTARLRIRGGAESYAALVEATVHVYAAELAERLHIPVTGLLGRRTGWEITCVLQGNRHLIDLTAHQPQ